MVAAGSAIVPMVFKLMVVLQPSELLPAPLADWLVV